MGVHISLVDEKWRDVPEWDCLRYEGDRDIAANMGAALPTVWKVDGDKRIDDERQRPSDFNAWRKYAATSKNPDRLGVMIDILERNPCIWIHISW
jgi:hypothetical protein